MIHGSWVLRKGTDQLGTTDQLEEKEIDNSPQTNSKLLTFQKVHVHAVIN